MKTSLGWKRVVHTPEAGRKTKTFNKVGMESPIDRTAKSLLLKIVEVCQSSKTYFSRGKF